MVFLVSTNGNVNLLSLAKPYKTNWGYFCSEYLQKLLLCDSNHWWFLEVNDKFKYYFANNDVVPFEDRMDVIDL